MAEDDVMNDGSDMLGKRGELILFLREVREKGMLVGEKHNDLRKKLEDLL